MASGLVQKCTVHFAVEVGSRSLRFFGPLLVRTRVRLLHSHLLKRTALRGKTNSSAIQLN